MTLGQDGAWLGIPGWDGASLLEVKSLYGIYGNKVKVSKCRTQQNHNHDGLEGLLIHLVRNVSAPAICNPHAQMITQPNPTDMLWSPDHTTRRKRQLFHCRYSAGYDPGFDRSDPTGG